jgi:hypothetical protein
MKFSCPNCGENLIENFYETTYKFTCNSCEFSTEVCDVDKVVDEVSKLIWSGDLESWYINEMAVLNEKILSKNKLLDDLYELSDDLDALRKDITPDVL